MRALAVFALSLSLACALAGCGGGTGAGSESAKGVEGGALVSELNAFTDELVGEVESARDTSEGLNEAQKLLDARREALAARVVAMKKGELEDAAARRNWLEAEVDNTDRVSRLQIKYLDASMRDPALKARLDKLISDYGSIFKDR